MLVLLRRKLGARIEAAAEGAPLAPLVKQFREVDARIRAIDVATADAAAQGDDDDGDEVGWTWNPDEL